MALRATGGVALRATPPPVGIGIRVFKTAVPRVSGSAPPKAGRPGEAGLLQIALELGGGETGKKGRWGMGLFAHTRLAVVTLWCLIWSINYHSLIFGALKKQKLQDLA